MKVMNEHERKIFQLMQAEIAPTKYGKQLRMWTLRKTTLNFF